MSAFQPIDFSILTLADFFAALEHAGCQPKKSGDGYIAFCPVHEADHSGHQPSLSITQGDSQNVLAYCHAGCDYSKIKAALGLQTAPKAERQRRIVATYAYHDATGKVVSEKVRYEPKDFRQRWPDPDHKCQWLWKKPKDTPAVLYRLLELLQGITARQIVYLVEGEKDADRLAASGLVATTNIEGASESGKKPKWRREYTEQLAGATRVILIPDNDDPGRAHMQHVAKQIHGKVGQVRMLELPGLPTKGDVSDWLKAGHTVEELAALATAALDAEPVIDSATRPTGKKTPDNAAGNPGAASGNRYAEKPDGIYWIIQKSGEPLEVKLCNFTARIVEELAHDDGVAEPTLALRVTGHRDGRDLPPIDMNWEQFTGMSWPAKQWSSGCLVEPGPSIKDTLRAAIQTLSHTQGATVERRTVYTHTGWRKVSGQWVYLHGGGAMGANGPVEGVETDLRDLARYNTLPNPSTTAQERHSAALASSGYLNLAALDITLPLLSAAFLAPFSQDLNVDFTIWVEGPSQSQKSTISALALAHFGAAMDRTCLTANWMATANALEGMLFTLADCLAVIDDYAPQPHSTAQAAVDTTVARIVRGVGNRQGRDRLTKDQKRQGARYPRGLVISTAEQGISGESLNGRLFGVSMRRGDVDLPHLTQMQERARSGLLARCMADFLHDVAGNRDQVIKECQEQWTAFRAKALSAGLTGRAPEQVAFLLVGAMLAAKHYRACGVDVDTTAWGKTLFSMTQRQAKHVLESQPAVSFRDTLRALLRGDSIHLKPVYSNGDLCDPKDILPLSGKCVGWDNESKGEVYLLAPSVLEQVNETLRKSDTRLNIKPSALWQQCRDRGWLQEGNKTETGCESTRTVKIDGQSTRVLVFDRSQLFE